MRYDSGLNRNRMGCDGRERIGGWLGCSAFSAGDQKYRFPDCVNTLCGGTAGQYFSRSDFYGGTILCPAWMRCNLRSPLYCFGEPLGDETGVQEKQAVFFLGDMLELQYGTILSPTVIPYDEYKKYVNDLPYYKNIEKEGIELHGHRLA